MTGVEEAALVTAAAAATETTAATATAAEAAALSAEFATIAQATGTAAAAAGITSTTTAFTISGSTALSLGLTAASIAANYLLQSRDKKQGDPNQVSIRQPIPSRSRAYGRVKVAGPKAFYDTSAATLFDVVVHCEGPIDAYEEWWLNDKNAGLTSGTLGGFNTSLPWLNAVNIESHIGEPDQDASPLLLASFPTSWTEDHRLAGLAYSVLILAGVPPKYISKFYPSGAPSLRVVLRGAKVYDPRDDDQEADDPDTWTWSRNAGLCILDYLRSSRGYGHPSSRINFASFAAFADLCDEAVSLKAGGTEPRYTLGGVYDLTEERGGVLNRMLAACEGEVYHDRQGMICIRGGKWAAPEWTLTEDMIIDLDLSAGNEKLAAFNRLKISVVSPTHEYQQIEIDPWDDEDNQELTGVVLSQDFSLPWVQSAPQGRRLAKIEMAKRNPAWNITATTGPVGALAARQRIINVNLPSYGISGTFLVKKHVIAGDFSTCQLELSSFNAAAYAWNAATEEGTAPVAPAPATVPVDLPVPENLTLSVVNTPITEGVAELMRIQGEVDAPANTSLGLKIQYRKVGDTDWLDMTSNGDWSAISNEVYDGDEYEVRAAFTAQGGQSIGPWTDIETIAPESSWFDVLTDDLGNYIADDDGSLLEAA